jgi:hypothetical protein
MVERFLTSRHALERPVIEDYMRLADAAGYGAAPTASGVYPLVTIEATAHLNASALAERLS